MQKLTGLHYADALDLNMGYYTIRISPTSHDTRMIVTSFGIFRNNLLPMGMYALGDIFQAKVEELLGDIEGLKAYINDETECSFPIQAYKTIFVWI